MNNATGPAFDEAVLTASVEKPAIVLASARPRVLTIAVPALVAVAFLLFCFLVQRRSGAWEASFASYPDEASHFVGSVMFRDYLASGFRAKPLAFAEKYYSQYPYFAVGYWPPLFYIFTALWFLAFGVGRVQALIIVAAANAGTAWLLFHLLRRRLGVVAAFCAGILYLSLPEVQRWTCAVMVDGMVALFSLAAAVFVIRYLEREHWVDSLGFAICAAGAILTKYSGAYISVLAFAAIIILRRWSLLRKPSFLVQPLLILAIAGPWVYWTRHYTSTGLLGYTTTFWHRLVFSPLQIFTIFPPLLLAVIVIGLAALLVIRNAWSTDLVVVGLLFAGLGTSFAVAPVEVELRYVLAGGAALLVLALAGWAAIAERLNVTRRHARTAVTTLAVVVAGSTLISHFLRYPQPRRYNIRSAVTAVLNQPASKPVRILAPPDLEGPTIAEFANLVGSRQNYELKRPIKLFTTGDWFLRNYECRVRTSNEMLNVLEDEQLDMLVWHGYDPARKYRHEDLMSEMLTSNPDRWKKVASIASTANDPFPWDVYRLVRK